MLDKLTSSPLGHFAACNKFLGMDGWYKYVPKANGATCSLDFGASNIGTIWLILAGLLDILIRIGIFAAVTFFIIGAFKMVTSQGSPEGIKSARATMTNSLIGLVLLVIGTWIVSFVIYNIFNVAKVA